MMLRPGGVLSGRIASRRTVSYVYKPTATCNHPRWNELGPIVPGLPDSVTANDMTDDAPEQIGAYSVLGALGAGG
jgi:hypothetical protein